MADALRGKVAVVTGASRGIGRGIALALADEGATVYVTGRTIGDGNPLGGSVGATAAEVDRRGGQGIAVQVDHGDDAQIGALFDRIRADQVRLDILVNNAMAIPPEMTQRIGFWEKPLSNWEIFDIGVRAAFVAAWHAARIMVPQRSGLIVALSGYVGVTYTYDTIFGVAKAATDRMARDLAIELKPHGVASLSLWQGFTYTERAQDNLRTVPGMASQLNSAAGTSVEFPGRVIAALACDPKVIARSGGTFINAELAADYGVTDVDGRTIPSLRAERGAPIWQPV
ncbi:SDR family NAD(P)-dependent oxidoreductase [Sphingomonas naphthae]|uniref:SDR family NAD(P)-dependent oxidoreductase n=1 Tax=Sphingomonas naphthae TaxID=1813468 RepID=A0ABY7TQA6_9SPHN|nr:SDR family NAD(P)-dependent oxidoreductase [Sphingomonas naphthae]WCT75171.1 SDR family NAD(P)-dependent oxidoreductase [Sphingomonas naphthae]